MRRINKDFSIIPADLQSVNCQKKIADSLVLFGKHKFDSGIYGSEGVRAALDALYHNKCVFCETDSSAGATPQVEHYRPKAKITLVPTHPGYYWLGYQWSNLLMACPSCNNKKRNQFPISGVRITTHPLTAISLLDAAACQSDSAVMMAEKPLLINPEVDADPMRHFRFTKAGKIEGQTTEGTTSIEVCNLNRKNLVAARKVLIIDSLYEDILQHLANFHSGLFTDLTILMYSLQFAIRKLIVHLTDEKKQYLAFSRVCWDNFDSFIITLFPSPIDQAHLRIAYTMVSNEPIVQALLAKL